MRVLLALFAIILVAAIVYADYKWRRWISARRAERDSNQDRRRNY
jgi:hypothetical protein